jgi:hypothetical protein
MPKLGRAKPSPAATTTVPAAGATTHAARGSVVTRPGAGGQVFQAGVTFGFAAAALVMGLGLMYGADALDAAARGMLWFAGLGVAGWLAELCLGLGLAWAAGERRRRVPAATAEHGIASEPGEDFAELSALLRAPAPAEGS